MVSEDRRYWHGRAHEEFERALAAGTPTAREAHVDLALLHLSRCRCAVDFCRDRPSCAFGATCAVSSRLAGLETLDVA